MHYFSLILLIILSLNTHAADINSCEKITLNICTSDKKEHIIDFNIEDLKSSRYFHINFELSSKTRTSESSYIFHTPSIDIFNKLINFIKNKELLINDFAELLNILWLQEQLEINFLDEFLLIQIKAMLPDFTSEELAAIFKFAYRTHRFGASALKSCLINYIGEHQQKTDNSARNSLAAHLYEAQQVIIAIDIIVASKANLDHKNSKFSQPQSFDAKILERARKISNKKRSPGSSVSAFSSEKDTENLRIVLKNTYNISTNLEDKKKASKKYKLQII